MGIETNRVGYGKEGGGEDVLLNKPDYLYLQNVCVSKTLPIKYFTCKLRGNIAKSKRRGPLCFFAGNKTGVPGLQVA